MSGRSESTREAGFGWVYGAHGLVHAYTLILPTVLILLRDEFSASYFLLGVVGTLSSMAFGVFGLPAGWLTDRWGARPMLLVSVAGPAVSCLLAGFAPNLALLAAAIFAIGLFGAFYHPAALTVITTEAERSGRALGRQGVVGNLGMGLAPVTLSGVASLTSWRASFLLMAALGALFTIGAARSLPRGTARHLPTIPSRPLEPASVLDAVRTPEVRWTSPWALVLVYFVSMGIGFIYSGYVAYLPAYLAQRSPGALSGVLAGGALTSVVLFFGMLGQWGGGRLAESRRLRTGYAAAVVLGGVIVALMAGTRGWPLVALGAIFSLLLFSCQPMGNALLARFTPRARRGLAFGVSFTLSYGVGSLSNASMGYVADNGGLQAVFLGLAAVAVPASLAALALAAGAGVRQNRGQDVSPSEVRQA